jgi:hypothetical protein
MPMYHVILKNELLMVTLPRYDNLSILRSHLTREESGFPSKDSSKLYEIYLKN